MARKKTADRVKDLFAQIESANRLWDRWAQEYEVRHLEDYYLGHQRRAQDGDQGEVDLAGHKRYIINLCYPTLETKLPSLLYNRPKAVIEPRPTRGDDVSGHARERAKLREDTLGTFVDDPRTRFMEQTFTALKESHYAFGVVEVGYTMDYIDNPNAGKPMTLPDETTMLQPERIPNPEKDPADVESLFLKHIPASRFRVSVSSRFPTEWNDWVGYFEWVPLADVVSNPNYKGTAGLKNSSALKKEFQGPSDSNPNVGEDADAAKSRTSMVKLWKIWSLRARCKYVMIEGHDKFLQEQPFKTLPLAALRHHEIMESWYPLPPMFNWLMPQDEQNDIREARRVHRKRFKRRYAVSNNLNDDAKAAMESGEDGVMIPVASPTDIVPIADAPLDSGVWRDDMTTKDDFMQITSVGGDQRGTASSETATQARIISENSSIRENFNRERVALWLCDIFRIMLRTIEEQMVLPMWIQRNVDPLGDDATGEAMQVALVYQQITAEQLGDLNFDIRVDVDTLSPATESQRREEWMAALSLITNPGIAMLLMASPFLMRKTLGFYNVKSERDLVEIQKGLMVALLGAGGAGAPGAPSQPSGHGNGAAGGPQGASPAPTPGAGDIKMQMMAQGQA